MEGTQLQSHFLISLEFSLVENYNTRFIKKFSQLNSDMQSYRCKDFSLKQVSGLVGGPDPRTLPLDLPLLWCPLISFLQHSVQLRTHQLLAIDARSELETQSFLTADKIKEVHSAPRAKTGEKVILFFN